MASIRPLPAIIAYFKTGIALAALVADRIAAKHKFGLDSRNAWPTPCKALQVRIIEGEPADLDTERQQVRLEVRCYGESEDAADQVWQALADILRTTSDNRVAVETRGGRALIYYIIPEASPEFDTLPDIEVDYVLITLVASVAEQPII